VEGDLHVADEESEETGHSIGFDFTVVSGVEVIPGLFEILIQILLSLSALKSQMSIEDFPSSLICIHLFKNKFTSWLSFISSLLKGVFRDHGVHELVVSIDTGAWSSESIWDLSLIFTEALITFEIVLVSFKTWMWVILVPFGLWTSVLSHMVNLSEVLVMSSNSLIVR
jgi:hypothetical protein|tara:strand:- start:231 stop:737 length:507 start_codon:yes stop_codon:yes gene_type:complete